MKKIVIFVIISNSLLVLSSDQTNTNLRRANSHIQIQIPIDTQPQQLSETGKKSHCSFSKIALTAILAGTLGTISYTIWRQENINSKINTLKSSIPTDILSTNNSITLPVTIPSLPVQTLLPNPTLPLLPTTQGLPVNLGSLSGDLGSLTGILDNLSGSSSNSLLP